MVNGWRRAVFRLGAAAGIAGPAAFTGAWIASSLRQTRQGPGGLQLSGLAAPDARDPWIMLAGFLVLGGCTVAFGSALRRALRWTATGSAGPGPALIQGAGLLMTRGWLIPRRRNPAGRERPPAARPGRATDTLGPQRVTGRVTGQRSPRKAIPGTTAFNGSIRRDQPSVRV